MNPANLLFLIPFAIYILLFVIIWRWASGILRALRSISSSLQVIAANRRTPDPRT